MSPPRVVGTARADWAALGVLLCVGVLLGLRSERAITAVLSSKRHDPPSAKAEAGPDDTLAALDHRDSLLAAATPSERDPFRDPPVKPRPRPVARERSSVKTPARRVAKPVLRALLYDRVAPSVQLAVGGSRSDWLNVGDEFGGWVVLEITEKSVTTAQAGDTLVLP